MMGEVRLGLVNKVMRWVGMGFVNWIREHVLWSQSRKHPVFSTLRNKHKCF